MTTLSYEAPVTARPQPPAPPVPVRDSDSAGVSPTVRVAVKTLDAYFGAARVVRGVGIDFLDGQVTAIIGPSGCGKSTLLRCLNRMHETVPTARTEGEVVLDGTDIYARGVNAIAVRRRIGMVFQRPTPFPTMSIRDNVAAGFKGQGRNASAIYTPQLSGRGREKLELESTTGARGARVLGGIYPA